MFSIHHFNRLAFREPGRKRSFLPSRGARNKGRSPLSSDWGTPTMGTTGSVRRQQPHATNPISCSPVFLSIIESKSIKRHPNQIRFSSRRVCIRSVSYGDNRRDIGSACLSNSFVVQSHIHSCSVPWVTNCVIPNNTNDAATKNRAKMHRI